MSTIFKLTIRHEVEQVNNVWKIVSLAVEQWNKLSVFVSTRSLVISVWLYSIQYVICCLYFVCLVGKGGLMFHRSLYKHLLNGVQKELILLYKRVQCNGFSRMTQNHLMCNIQHQRTSSVRFTNFVSKSINSPGVCL